MKFDVRNFSQSLVAYMVVGCAVVALAMMQPATSVAAGSKAKNRGAKLFATRGCVHCHGPAGVGGGKGPDLQLVRKRMKKAQITRQIHDGGKNMPAFGDALTMPEIDDLVAYLRARRKVILVVARPPALALAPVAADSDPN
jgi:ubiquinol-cytochrome c reductase cytochrome b subunit